MSDEYLSRKSGGKPTFLTLRSLITTISSCLKADPSKGKLQLEAAQGQEGGLAPAFQVRLITMNSLLITHYSSLMTHHS